MTTYVTIPDTAIDLNSPLTQPIVFALRDNLLATAEGSSGAPKILNAAFADGTIGHEKFQSDAVSTAITLIGAGGIGSYAFGYASTTDVAFGDIVSGITVTSAARAGDWGIAVSGGFSGTAAAGTWRCMGLYDASASVGTGQDPAFLDGATLWLRVA